VNGDFYKNMVGYPPINQLLVYETKIMENKYNATLVEAELESWWHQHKVHAAENNPGPVWSIDTPPPTVSGSLHIGHVFSYTQTDITARYKRMQGHSVFYPIGFDDNGLATERYVEKKM